jgi:hypothetical protein
MRCVLKKKELADECADEDIGAARCQPVCHCFGSGTWRFTARDVDPITAGFGSINVADECTHSLVSLGESKAQSDYAKEKDSGFRKPESRYRCSE